MSNTDMRAAPAKPQFRLVALDTVSRDTVACLRDLLARAERGEVVGLAYAAMHKRRKYAVHICGEADRNPTFARGMVDALSDELARRVWGTD
jgi:hypothetical protein